jgi:trehalose 6-phosphate phosphatase
VNPTLKIKRAILASLTKHPHLLLFLDYDGTLTPIVRTPGQATLAPKTRRILKRLAKRKRVTVALVSGRKLSDVQKMVRVSGITYAGNHGLELRGGGYRFVNAQAKRSIPILRKLKRTLAKELKHIPRAWVEDKKLTLTVHYREVPKSKWRAVKKVVLSVSARARKRGLVKLTRGKCVTELRPNTSWGKGAVVRWLIGKRDKALSVYIGDDVTDEAAFAAVNRVRGVSVLVGLSHRKTNARYRIPSPRHLTNLLRSI